MNSSDIHFTKGFDGDPGILTLTDSFMLAIEIFLPVPQEVNEVHGSNSRLCTFCSFLWSVCYYKDL